MEKKCRSTSGVSEQSRNHIRLINMKTKNKLFLCLLCGAVLLATGCKKNEEPQPQPTQTLKGSVAKPSWAFDKKYDFTISMLAVVKVDLLKTYPEIAKDYVLKDEDIMAAFIGETCIDVRSPKDGVFNLYMSLPINFNNDEKNVTLRYWSAHYTNTFEAADVFQFENDVTLGTPDPLTPSFTVSGK